MSRSVIVWGEVGSGRSPMTFDGHGPSSGPTGSAGRGGNENVREEVGGEYIWALRDISFEVEPREVLGIIGSQRGGQEYPSQTSFEDHAPTQGTIKARGRNASLLEVERDFILNLRDERISISTVLFWG